MSPVTRKYCVINCEKSEVNINLHNGFLILCVVDVTASDRSTFHLLYMIAGDLLSFDFSKILL
jgi:hypothetical protein